MKIPLIARTLALCGLLAGPSVIAQDATPAEALVPNSSLEADVDGDQWPDSWPKAKEGGSWEVEEGNHFIRLTSPKPGAMVMLYGEIPIPQGVHALEISWKQRVTGLQRGEKSWYDARLMMEFANAAREKVSPAPKPVASAKDTEGWVEKSTHFLVPEGATMLKFMPSLFLVAAGTLDLDDIVIKTGDETAIRAEAEAAAQEYAKKLEEQTTVRRAKALEHMQAEGNIIPNGGFEEDKNQDSWPDKWGKLKEGGSWELEDGNHFLRMTTTKPGEMAMIYQQYDIPEGLEALELTWRQRVTGLVKGEKPWFDARILFEFKGADGKSLTEKPGPAYTQKDTKGWVDKSTRFLVPKEAVTLVMMPSLFQTKAGTMDLDDLSLAGTDPAPILAKQAEAAKAEAAKFVPPEEPKKEKWPKMLHVAGNRLQDSDGKEVWLQGVNAGGLETLPQDTQPIKSTVVAIDEWRANCIRLPMNEAFWYGKSPYQNDGGKQYRDNIDQIVTLAANRGAYVAIDLHRFRAPKQEHADFWKDCAEKYKDHPAVLFDVFNEPHGISWEIWQKGGFVGNEKGADESAFLTEEEKKKNQGFDSVGMQGLVDAVRSTGAKNIIIAGGLFWCNDLTGVTEGYALDDKGGNGIMYSWHTYNWHTDWEKKVLAAAAKYPIFLGEVGADTHKMDFIPLEAQEDPYTWVPDMLGFIQKYHLNWTGWCLHPGATPLLISDWNYTPTPYWGIFAQRALAGEQFELKRTR